MTSPTCVFDPSVDSGTRVIVASLSDVIRTKEAAGREKDRLVLGTLRKSLERLEEAAGS